MGAWERHVVPHLVRWACSAEPVDRQRRKIVPRARGRVLELGVGGGMNLPHYDLRAVTSLAGVDPSEPLLEDARRAARALPIPVELHRAGAEALPFEDRSFDTVLVTYTLCSVLDLDAALAEARRVLDPDGRLLFVEHGLAPDPEVARWQRRIEPLWKRLGGGCHLTRDVPARLGAAGLCLEDLETLYLPGPRALNWNAWGSARVEG